VRYERDPHITGKVAPSAAASVRSCSFNPLGKRALRGSVPIGLLGMSAFVIDDEEFVNTHSC
jgi:hypothetical protein